MRFEIDSDRPLAEVCRNRIGAVPAVASPKRPCPVAVARRFDLDDIRPMLGQQHPAIGTRHPLAQVDHLEPGEGCLIAHVCFLRGRPRPHPRSLLNTMVPLAANMPPTPWAMEILAPLTCAAATPRIWRTPSCSAYMPYMPECM